MSQLNLSPLLASFTDFNRSWKISKYSKEIKNKLLTNLSQNNLIIILKVQLIYVVLIFDIYNIRYTIYTHTLSNLIEFFKVVLHCFSSCFGFESRIVQIVATQIKQKTI